MARFADGDGGCAGDAPVSVLERLHEGGPAALEGIQTAQGRRVLAVGRFGVLGKDLDRRVAGLVAGQLDRDAEGMEADVRVIGLDREP